MGKYSILIEGILERLIGKRNIGDIDYDMPFSLPDTPERTRMRDLMEGWTNGRVTTSYMHEYLSSHMRDI